MSTYALTANFNVQSIGWAGAGALWALLRTLLVVLSLAVCFTAVFAVVVAFWLPICQVIGALAIIAAFAWLTYPRTRVRP